MNLKKNFVSDEEIIKRLIHKLNITFPKIKTLTIRLHPTEKKKKYRFLGKKYNNLNITFDNNQNILDTLIRSKLVIGFDSMGIVIANSMKIKSYNLDLQNINEKNVIPRKYYFDKLKI